ncbi:MAG: response regulator [Candidatus Dormibacter sp.]
MAAARSRPRQQNGSPEDALQVVFIGDDRGLAELYRLKLELDGYWVTLSSSIDDGLNRIRKQMPDLVFIDLGAGEQLKTTDLGALRQDATLSEVPVVLLSRRDSDAIEATGFQLGSLDFLVRVDTVPGEDFWTDSLESSPRPRHI